MLVLSNFARHLALSLYILGGVVAACWQGTEATWMVMAEEAVKEINCKLDVILGLLMGVVVLQH